MPLSVERDCPCSPFTGQHGWFPLMSFAWPWGERWPFRHFKRVRCLYCSAKADKATALRVVEECGGGRLWPRSWA